MFCENNPDATTAIQRRRLFASVNVYYFSGSLLSRLDRFHRQDLNLPCCYHQSYQLHSIFENQLNLSDTWNKVESKLIHHDNELNWTFKMNKKNPINISKSSLVGLQAELARKREELSRNRTHTETKSKRLELKPHFQEQLKNLKQKTKAKGGPVPNWTEEDEISSKLLDQSKEALIVKTALYEKLRKQELKATNDDQYLVNFQDDRPRETSTGTGDESVDDDGDPDSEWVTYKDSLGRTRTCLRTDISYYKQLDSKLAKETRREEPPSPEESVEEQPLSHRRPVVLSEEMRLWEEKREKLRTQWEEEEKKLMQKRDIHYQDVLFDEARMHGVGFFQFSKDEAEREKQHEELRKLRIETEKNQELTMSLKERRAQQMKQRILAAKRRKRERLGLPPVEEDDVAEDEEIEEEKKEEPKPEEILAKNVEEYLQSVERSRHVRPWDVGKDGVKPRVLSQEEYNERQRAKREKEFAPPSTYKIDTYEDEEEPIGLRFTTKKKKRNAVEDIPIPIDAEYDIEANAKKVKVTERQGTEIPPPLSYDKASTSKKSKKPDLGESIEMGLNRLRREAETKGQRREPIAVEII